MEPRQKLIHVTLIRLCVAASIRHLHVISRWQVYAYTSNIGRTDFVESRKVGSSKDCEDPVNIRGDGGDIDGRR